MLDFIIDRLGDLAEFFIYLWSEKVFKKPSKKKTDDEQENKDGQ